MEGSLHPASVQMDEKTSHSHGIFGSVLHMCFAVHKARPLKYKVYRNLYFTHLLPQQ